MLSHLVLVGAVAAILSGVAIPCTMPLLRRYAMARPNSRSSHASPTPQGAGLDVVAAALLACGIGWASVPGSLDGLRETVALAAAMAVLCAVGAWDDLRPLGPAPKIVAQLLAVGLVVVVSTPPDARLFPAVPRPLEWGAVLLAGIWFVNLVNFMDGIDWITAVGCGIPLAALALMGAALGAFTLPGAPDLPPLLAVAALCGALLGFMPFNRPPARVFLGDVGSLPIGLALAYGLYRLALAGHFAAAVILPLYYLWDSGLTLGRRALRRERVWQAHRSHIYQRATDAGWSVLAVVTIIGALDIALAGVAALAVWRDEAAVSLPALGLAVLLVALASRLLLAGPRRLNRPPAERAGAAR